MKGNELYFHKEQKECDFLVRKENRMAQAIRVTLSLSDEEVKNREISGLIEAMKTHDLTEGWIITENEQEILEINEYKIMVIPIWKWLIDGL